MAVRVHARSLKVQIWLDTNRMNMIATTRANRFDAYVNPFLRETNLSLLPWLKDNDTTIAIVDI